MVAIHAGSCRLVRLERELERALRRIEDEDEAQAIYGALVAINYALTERDQRGAAALPPMIARAERASA